PCAGGGQRAGRGREAVADDVRAALLAPLVSGDTYLGYLAFVRTGPGRTYAETDVALAPDIAAIAASARAAGRGARPPERGPPAPTTAPPGGGSAWATARSVDQLRASEERYRRIV